MPNETLVAQTKIYKKQIHFSTKYCPIYDYLNLLTAFKQKPIVQSIKYAEQSALLFPLIRQSIARNNSPQFLEVSYLAYIGLLIDYIIESTPFPYFFDPNH
jgi:hypothetical protein